MINISGDSGEYELLTQGIELSKGVDGICVEIGLRLGLGTKTIIDAVRQYSPNKTVISIDPYGSILYTCREPDGPCRLDYDNNMKNTCLSNIYQYIVENPVSYQFYNWTDSFYFDAMRNGVPVYDLEETIVNKYSFAFLDGPHTVKHICREIDFFAPRMDKGAIIILDDITPDFYNVLEVEDYMKDKFEIVYKGEKKGIYRRI
jgi:hypothetical protein